MLDMLRGVISTGLLLNEKLNLVSILNGYCIDL